MFFWEYFGPLVIYPLFYFLPIIYVELGSGDLRGPRALVQTLGVSYWSLHYAKRIIETFTIHKYAQNLPGHSCGCGGCVIFSRIPGVSALIGTSKCCAKKPS